MIRIHLPTKEQILLEQRFTSTSDRKLRDRLQMVLMAHRQRRHPDIATDLGIGSCTVQRWLNAYLDQGLMGLQPREAPGATAKYRRASLIPSGNG